MALSKAEREQFLAEPHIGALSVSAGAGRGPLTVPIWYQYTPGGKLWLLTGLDSRKHKLIEAAGHLSLMAERLEPTVRYVAVDGPVLSIETGTDEQLVEMAERHGCGMVIMSAHGSGVLREALMGSVSQSVLHASPVPVLIVQHMPPVFTRTYAQHLAQLCPFEVKEAADGDRVMPGRVLIAPGGRHMQVVRSGAQYVVSVRDGPLVNRHKPSVDVLFKSVAQHAGANAAGAILTGMGDDGTLGCQAMKERGAAILAQDEATCVVYGMPRAVAEAGLVDVVGPLETIAARINESSLVGATA